MSAGSVLAAYRFPEVLATAKPELSPAYFFDGTRHTLVGRVFSFWGDFPESYPGGEAAVHRCLILGRHGDSEPRS